MINITLTNTRWTQAALDIKLLLVAKNVTNAGTSYTVSSKNYKAVFFSFKQITIIILLYSNSKELTVSLSPAEVVTEIGGRWVENNTPIKSRRIEERSGGEELGPMEDKRGGKVGDHCADELAGKRK